MRRILVLGMLAALVVGAVAEPASAVVPAKTVKSKDGLFKVFIPRGAMRVNKRIVIVTRLKSSLPADLRAHTMPGRKIYEVRPHGLRFLKPATVTWRIRQPGGFSAAGGIPGAILASRNQRGRWALLRDSTVRLAGNEIIATAKTWRFSTVTAFAYGATLTLTPGSVTREVGQTFEATVTLTEDADADIGRNIWTADGVKVKLIGDLPDTSNTRTARFRCAEAGEGYYGYRAEVRDAGAGSAIMAYFALLSHNPLTRVQGEFEVKAPATCTQPGSAAPTCAEPPRAAPTNHNGEAKVQFTALCPRMLPELDHVTAAGPAGSTVTEYNAHSTSCAFEGTVAVTCKVKPDGRVCMILKFTPPLAAGSIVRVRLGRADGSVILEQDLTVGANGEDNCSTGP